MEDFGGDLVGGIWGEEGMMRGPLGWDMEHVQGTVGFETEEGVED